MFFACNFWSGDWKWSGWKKETRDFGDGCLSTAIVQGEGVGRGQVLGSFVSMVVNEIRHPPCGNMRKPVAFSECYRSCVLDGGWSQLNIQKIKPFFFARYYNWSVSGLKVADPIVAVIPLYGGKSQFNTSFVENGQFDTVERYNSITALVAAHSQLEKFLDCSMKHLASLVANVMNGSSEETL